MGRILFVAPAMPQDAGSKSLFPPLSLAMLAGMTPRGWDMRILDEAVEPLDFNDPADVVAITSITAVAPRAYEVADEFRRRGKTVIMGGMHPSAVPAEACQHADAVVVGEAEPVWRDVLNDYGRGSLQPVYKADRWPDLSGLPLPRRDLFRPKGYLLRNVVQTSRGCPFGCEFCAVTRFFGRSYRVRPVEEVVREVESLENRTVLFVDDNIVGNPAHAKRLFEGLRRLRIRWVGQSSLNIASDPELLALASRSGCAGLFIGFESLVTENLERIGKSVINKVESFRAAIRRIHAHGIGIEGAFIFGFDGDDAGVIKKTVQFAKRVRLEAAQFGLLTPFPGTPLYSRMDAEGRIVDRDWSQYTISRAVFEPLKMSRESLTNAVDRAYAEFYSWRSILSRLALGMRRNMGFFLPLNIAFRRVRARSRAVTSRA